MAPTLGRWRMTRARRIAVLGIVLAGLLLVLFRWSGPAPPAGEPRRAAWSVDFELIDGIAIDLRAERRRQKWVRGDDGEWYFDAPGGARVDDQRWGGGIPLLVSGPAAQRLIADQVSEAQLAIYGLADPQMTVRLTTADAAPIDIEVGARTPDGGADYVRVAGAPTVYAIHHTWKDVLARLVTDPPIARQ